MVRTSSRKSSRKSSKRVGSRKVRSPKRVSSRKSSKRVSSRKERSPKRISSKRVSSNKNGSVRIVKFTRSKKENKKYDAHLSNGKVVSFGDKRYQQYKDKVPLHLYSHLNHNDPVRRNSYKARHSAIKSKNGRLSVNNKYTPAWFSMKYLW